MKVAINNVVRRISLFSINSHKIVIRLWAEACFVKSGNMGQFHAYVYNLLNSIVTYC